MAQPDSTPLDTARLVALATLAGFAIQQAIQLLDMPLSAFVEVVKAVRTNHDFPGGLSEGDFKKSVATMLAFTLGLLFKQLSGITLLGYIRPEWGNTFGDYLVTALVLSAGTEGFNTLLKYVGYVKEMRKATAAAMALTANNAAGTANASIASGGTLAAPPSVPLLAPITPAAALGPAVAAENTPAAAPNVDRILFMRTQFANGPTTTLGQFQDDYRFEPDGVNCYYGINAAASAGFRATGSALHADHRAVLKDVVDALARSAKPDKAVVLGLWPYEPIDPYGFVLANLPLLGKLAEELGEYQAQAANFGKRLLIVVRYASEMNDPRTEKQPWGRQPGKVHDRDQQALFKDSFQRVKEEFTSRASDIQFTFSPALRSDIDTEEYGTLPDYWPGDSYVNRLSCTWYVGRNQDLPGAVRVLRTYCTDRLDKGLGFGIDEMGGINVDRGNDTVLQQMFQALAGFEPAGIRFDYATIFLNEKWGTDAKLAFLRGSSA